MGNDNLFLLERQFSLLLGKCSQGSIFLSTQRQINRFCLKNMKCSAAGDVRPPRLAAPSGSPHLLRLTVGGWAITQVLLWQTWEVPLGKPLFSSGIWVCVSICDPQRGSRFQAALTALHQRQELYSLGKMTLRRTS